MVLCDYGVIGSTIATGKSSAITEAEIVMEGLFISGPKEHLIEDFAGHKVPVILDEEGAVLSAYLPAGAQAAPVPGHGLALMIVFARLTNVWSVIAPRLSVARPESM
jgi:hypothetical protein